MVIEVIEAFAWLNEAADNEADQQDKEARLGNAVVVIMDNVLRN